MPNWAGELEELIQHNSYGNDPKTKVLVFTPNKSKEEEYVENLIRSKPGLNKVRFCYMECGLDGKVEERKKVAFLQEFLDKEPTLIVFSYKHGAEYLEGWEDLKNQRKNKVCDLLRWSEKKTIPNKTIPDILYDNLKSAEVLHKALIPNDYLIIEPHDIYYLEGSLLFSLVPATTGGLAKKVRDLLKKKQIERSEENTRLLIVAGGHGSPMRNDRPTPVNGLSAFSCKSSLDYSFYKEMCEAFGYNKESADDPCNYVTLGERRCVSNIDTKKVKGYRNSKLTWASWNQGIKVAILNIAYYHTGGCPCKACEEIRKQTGQSAVAEEKGRHQNIKHLIDDIKKLDPTHFVIDWCYGSNGDLAIAIRAAGFFSEMLLNHDLRKITGNPNAKLTGQQAKILRIAQDDDKQYLMLKGPKGSGKSILAAEIAKIKYAKLIEGGATDAGFDIKLINYNPDITYECKQPSFL